MADVRSLDLFRDLSARARGAPNLYEFLKKGVEEICRDLDSIGRFDDCIRAINLDAFTKTIVPVNEHAAHIIVAVYAYYLETTLRATCSDAEAEQAIFRHFEMGGSDLILDTHLGTIESASWLKHARAICQAAMDDDYYPLGNEPWRREFRHLTRQINEMDEDALMRLAKTGEFPDDMVLPNIPDSAVYGFTYPNSQRFYCDVPNAFVRRLVAYKRGWTVRDVRTKDRLAWSGNDMNKNTVRNRIQSLASSVFPYLSDSIRSIMCDLDMPQHICDRFNPDVLHAIFEKHGLRSADYDAYLASRDLLEDIPYALVQYLVYDS